MDFEMLDLSLFDIDSMQFLENCSDRVEIVLQWIQRLIVEAESNKAIKIAPPILSRVYNQLGNGIVWCSELRTINDISIPFPFVHALTVLLIVHTFLTPFLIAAAVESAFWAAVDTFLVVTCFWVMNYIALELEYPFGNDTNNLPTQHLQVELNRSIVGLLQRRALQPPGFNFQAASKVDITIQEVGLSSIKSAVLEMKSSRDLGDIVPVAKSRKSSVSHSSQSTRFKVPVDLPSRCVVDDSENVQEDDGVVNPFLPVKAASEGSRPSDGGGRGGRETFDVVMDAQPLPPIMPSTVIPKLGIMAMTNHQARC
jgi:hypothetical protein